MIKTLLSMIKEHEAKYLELRFCDTVGVEHFLSVPTNTVDENFMENVKLFDGSSIRGWQTIDKSDMMLRPDLSTVFLDPFAKLATLAVRCDVFDPYANKPYLRDPRSIAKRAEAYLKQTGIADTCYVGPEPEFFIF